MLKDFLKPVKYNESINIKWTAHREIIKKIDAQLNNKAEMEKEGKREFLKAFRQGLQAPTGVKFLTSKRIPKDYISKFFNEIGYKAGQEEQVQAMLERLYIEERDSIKILNPGILTRITLFFFDKPKL
ncbi:MAG: hypothetical protein KBT01_08705 [Clostridiales bacterium]|nr:hypothetical protein [Candidatus Blautia equi]